MLLRSRGFASADLAALSTLGDANWSPTVQVSRGKWAEVWSPKGLARRYAHHALNVARDGVDLDVHAVARRELRKIRDLKRVRNHVDLKTAARLNVFDSVDREAHAVDGDRTFFCDEFAEFCGHFNFEQPALGEIFPLGHEARGVYVSGDEVTAELVGERRGFFEVD